jgi:hypothetical protein
VTESNEVRVTSRRHRPWYRLHLGTCVALVFLAVLLLWANDVPRDVMSPDWRILHGWPLVYLKREAHLFYEFTDCLPFDEAVVLAFRPLSLALNAVIGAVVLLSYGAATEYWLRARKKPSQFSLRSLLAFVAFFAVTLSVFKSGLLGLSLWDAAVWPIRLAIASSVLAGAYWLLRARRKARTRSTE